jgi:type IV secretory pathway VirB3-like protein
MSVHEPTIWTIVLAYLLVSASMVLLVIVAIVVLFVALILGAAIVCFVSTVVYSVAAICVGPDCRLCVLILELEQEELAFRLKRCREAREARTIYTQSPALGVQQADYDVPLFITVQ